MPQTRALSFVAGLTVKISVPRMSVQIENRFESLCVRNPYSYVGVRFGKSSSVQ